MKKRRTGANVAYSLLGPRQKLDRAKHHINDLNSKITEFFGRNNYALFFEPNAKPDLINIVLRGVHEQLPECLPLVVGDVLHNLRSSLDHLACAVCHSTKDIQFPISADKKGFDAMVARRKIDRAGKKAIAVMDSLQSYRCPEGADLLALNGLNNRDKHRLLIPIVGVSKLRGVSITGADGSYSWHNEWNLPIERLEDGAVVKTMPFYNNIKIGDQLDPRFVTFDVLLGPGPYGNEPLCETLMRLAGRVEETITALSAFV